VNEIIYVIYRSNARKNYFF